MAKNGVDEKKNINAQKPPVRISSISGIYSRIPGYNQWSKDIVISAYDKSKQDDIMLFGIC